MLLTPGRQVMYTRSTRDRVAATITGPSQNGDQYLAIRYLRHGAYVEQPCALVTSIELPIRTPSPPAGSPSPSLSRSRSPPPPSRSWSPPSPSRSRSHSSVSSLHADPPKPTSNSVTIHHHYHYPSPIDGLHTRAKPSGRKAPKSNITAYLHFAIKLSIGVDGDGMN